MIKIYYIILYKIYIYFVYDDLYHIIYDNIFSLENARYNHISFFSLFFSFLALKKFFFKFC